MREQLGAEAAWHMATARRLLGLTPPWVLLVPAVGALVIYLLDQSPAVSPYLGKEAAEIVSPIILAVALALAVRRAALRAHAYDIWLALFALALFLRELHFLGTNTGFYIALVLLLWWASHARDRLEPFISDRRVVILTMMMLWTYFITKTLDRHYWDGILPAGTTNDLFEENLEIMGHIMFLVLVIVSGSVTVASREG